MINAMPEGPTIVLLKEEVQQFTRKRIITADGNAKMDMERFRDQKVIAFKSWGKHFLIQAIPFGNQAGSIISKVAP
jgi:endonuclease-8